MVGLRTNSTNSYQNISNGNIPHVTPGGMEGRGVPTLAELTQILEVHTRNMDLMKETINHILDFLIKLTSELGGTSALEVSTPGTEASSDLRINSFTTYEKPVEQEVTHLIENICELLHFSRDQRTDTFSALNQISSSVQIAPPKPSVEEVSLVPEHSIDNISFGEEDRMTDEGHDRALYVTGFIKGIEFKRALVDTGASTNIVTMKTLRMAGSHKVKSFAIPS